MIELLEVPGIDEGVPATTKEEPMDPLLVDRPIPRNPVQQGQIYLPFWYSAEEPLHLVVYETFGRPVRYLDSPDNTVLDHYRNLIGRIVVKRIPKKIIVGESYSFDVSYSIHSVRDSYWLTRPPGTAFVRSIPITQFECLMKPGFPEELRSALLMVVEEELA